MLPGFRTASLKTTHCIELLARGVSGYAPGTQGASLFILFWRWKLSEVIQALKAQLLGV